MARKAELKNCCKGILEIVVLFCIVAFLGLNVVDKCFNQIPECENASETSSLEMLVLVYKSSDSLKESLHGSVLIHPLYVAA